MKVSVGISNRHIHLSDIDYKTLFKDTPMEIRNKLKQPGQFASNLVVDIEGPKGRIEKVRLLGPNRDYTQVEISKTDSYKLGVNPPIRNSGDLSGSSLITIIGPYGKIEKECCIIATRHIHVDEKIIKERKLDNIEEVKIKIFGEKSGIIDHVYLKKTDDAFFELHLDTDDANAFLLNQDDEVEIIL